MEDENLQILNRNDTHTFVCLPYNLPNKGFARGLMFYYFYWLFLIRRINKSLRWFGVVCVPVSAIVEVTIHMPEFFFKFCENCSVLFDIVQFSFQS